MAIFDRETPLGQQLRDVAAAIGASQGLSIAVSAAIARGYLSAKGGEGQRPPTQVPAGLPWESCRVSRDRTVWAASLAFVCVRQILDEPRVPQPAPPDSVRV